MTTESGEPGDTLTLADGRQLGYLALGEGQPVVYIHGFPECRLEALFLQGIAASRCLRVVGVDRPGFGLSTYAPRRTCRDFAADVGALADHLHLGSFAIVGWSMGAHYATVCAALLARRVTRAVAIAGFDLPVDTTGMKATNRIGLAVGTISTVGPWLLKPSLKMYLRMGRDPDTFFATREGRNYLKGQSADEVRFQIDRSDNRHTLFRSVVDGLRREDRSLQSVVQEFRILKSNWDADLSQVPPGLLHLWHGTADSYVPVINAHRKAKAIPGANLRLFDNVGHYFWLDHLEELADLISPR